jgi:excisionase family DNA binding protein
MQDHYTTVEVARLLGMAVRSVQLMVDKGVLEAWKTLGGHRRITRASVERFLAARNSTVSAQVEGNGLARAGPGDRAPLRILRIAPTDPSSGLLHALVREHLPEAELHVADDGIAGLALAGRLEPDLLLVDLMLPGIEGRQLISSLHSNPQFRRSRVAFVTDLDAAQRAAYAGMLAFVTVLHRSRLAEELPPLLASLPRTPAPGGG